MAGERVALTDSSGSGKTTLLNCLSGDDRPDSGSIWVEPLVADQELTGELGGIP